MRPAPVAVSCNIHLDVVATEDNTLVFLVLGDSVTANDTTWVGEEIWEWDPETDALDRRWISSDFMSTLTDRGPVPVSETGSTRTRSP